MIDQALLYLPFDDPNRLGYDHVSERVVGEELGDVAHRSAGIVGGAAGFDGDGDGILIADFEPALTLGQQYTIMAFARAVLFKRNSIFNCQGDPQVDLNIFEGVPHGRAYNAHLSDNEDYRVDAPTGQSSSDWIHLAMSVDGAEVVLYIDGDVAATRTVVPPIANPYERPTCHLGTSGYEVSVRDLQGDIDEAMLFGDVLNAAQIKVLADRR